MGSSNEISGFSEEQGEGQGRVGVRDVSRVARRVA